MKKILCVIIMLIFFCLMFNTVCFANIDTSTSMNKISFDSSSVQRFVDNNLSDNQYLPSINIKKLIDEFLVSGSLNFNSHALIKGLIDFVLHEAVTSTFLMFELIAIAVLFALLKNLTLSYGDDGVNEIANYTCILIMAIIIIKSFVPVLNIAKNTINEMNELINIMLPPLISMVALSGGISSAATLDPIVVAAIKITTDLIHTIILPMTVFIVVLNIIDALSINIKVTKLASLIKEITLLF